MTDPTTTNDLVYVTGTQLLACLQIACENATEGSVPKNFQFLPGETANADMSQYRDLCCEGTAYVRLASLYPAGTNWPAPDTEGSQSFCMPFALGGIWELGIMRCAPTGNARQIATSAAWNAAFAQQMIDARSMREATCCYKSTYANGAGVLMGTWTPVGPEGGCLIGTQAVNIENIGCGSDC
jgi:hypothetical protein